MVIRKIRFDEDEEKMLATLEEETCLPISEVIRVAVRKFAESKPGKLAEKFGEYYSRQDLGPGGDAAGPSDRTSEVFLELVKKKLNR